MKKFIKLLTVAATLFAVGCQKYNDTPLKNRVGELENRVAALEELCKQMNTNISSLQTIVKALQNNDYVTAVTPVTKNGETIGYTIAFSKSAPITIYHGENGKDGADGKDGVNGKDGNTPVIGVRQDSDGVYYWTLDGEWLLDGAGNKIKAEGRDGQNGADGKDGINGSDGKDGQDGKDGVNGSDGKDGANGKDGITPQLKIENGYWYVSTDNGATWTNLGKATGEDGANGTDGKNGIDGDSFFQSVDTTDSEYVVFTLADGTQIKLPTWYAFEQLRTLCNQMNTNINALQAIVTALQDNDYVKSVTPIMQDGKEIGYTITFSKSNPVTIYHGKDGANGADGKDGVNGKDGNTPVIGVRQDSDGVYYWTLDGEWLLDGAGNKIKAEGRDGEDGVDGKDGINGSDGKDGQDGKDGVNGSDGKDGANGKDGITPQLKIENGYWYVSTDNGATWTNLGKATGEDGANGADGKDGIDGDSFFQSVTQDEDNVYFTLADGTIITIPKKPRLAISFAESTSLTFDVDETKTIIYTISGGSSNNVVKAEMLNNDGNYTLYTTANSSTKGAIKITAKIPTANRVIVSVSDGNHTIMAAIDVTLKASFDGSVITVETPGTLAKLIADYDKTTISELTVIGNLNSSDISTLRNLPNLTVLDLENVNLEELTNVAFYDQTSLTDVKLPKTLKSIGNSAFSDCSSLTSITIPNSVTSIENYAFYGCSSLTSITIPNSVTSIGHHAFYGCSSLTSITIPDSVTSIGGYTFEGCSSITSINIPDGVTSIGGYTFSGCSSITSINIPDGVTSIGSFAFEGCSSLTSITIPDGITSIEHAAFSGCSSITSIYCKVQTPPSINYAVFSYWSQCTLYVPTGCKEAYAAADYWKNAKEIIEMEF